MATAGARTLMIRPARRRRAVRRHHRRARRRAALRPARAARAVARRSRWAARRRSPRAAPPRSACRRRLVGVVGDDDVRRLPRCASCRRRGVDTAAGAGGPAVPTGSSTHLTRPDGDRAILTAMGSIGRVAAADVPMASRRSRTCTSGSYFLQEALWAEAAALFARARAPRADDLARRQLRSRPSSGIAASSTCSLHTDVFFGNEQELAASARTAKLDAGRRNAARPDAATTRSWCASSEPRAPSPRGATLHGTVRVHAAVPAIAGRPRRHRRRGRQPRGGLPGGAARRRVHRASSGTRRRMRHRVHARSRRRRISARPCVRGRAGRPHRAPRPLTRCAQAASLSPRRSVATRSPSEMTSSSPMSEPTATRAPAPTCVRTPIFAPAPMAAPDAMWACGAMSTSGRSGIRLDPDTPADVCTRGDLHARFDVCSGFDDGARVHLGAMRDESPAVGVLAVTQHLTAVVLDVDVVLAHCLLQRPIMGRVKD